MNRTIKFRAWDEADGLHRDISSMSYGVAHNCDADAIMQYTGLKDKNGKEIYVGDIVEFVGGTCSYLSCGTYASQSVPIGEKLEVKDLLSGFTLSLLTLHGKQIPNLVGHVGNYTFWNHQRSLKVVGNIFQHPDLLKTKP